MSDKKTIVEALFEVQRKINEQRMKNSIDNYNAITEQEEPSYIRKLVKSLYNIDLPDFSETPAVNGTNKAVPPSDTSFTNTEPGYSGTQGKILDYNRRNPQPPSERLPVNNGQGAPQAPVGRSVQPPAPVPAANTAMPPPPQRPPAQQPAANTAMPSTREPTGNDLYRTPGSQSDAPPERAARTDLRPLVNRAYGARVARPDAATLLDRQQNKDVETMRNSNDPTLGSRENQLAPNPQTPPPAPPPAAPATPNGNARFGLNGFQSDTPPVGEPKKPGQLSGPGPTPRTSFGLNGPAGVTGNASDKFSTDKPAPTPPPRPAPAVQRPAPPPRPAVDPNARSKEMFQSYQNRKDQGDDSAASFFAADAQRMKEQGQRTPNDFSQEESGKTKGKNKMYESNNPMIAAFLALQEANPENMFEAMKRAKKDYDKDGKIESEKDEVWGSRFRAARKAGEMKEASTTDPDLHPELERDDATKTLKGKPPTYKPAAPGEDFPGRAIPTPPLPPVRPKNLRETEEIDEALTHDMDAGELRQHLATKYGHIEDGHPVTVPTRRTYMHHVNRLSKMIGMHPDKVRKQVKKDYANMDDMRNEEVGFSDAELAHFASVFETAVAPQTDSNAADVGQRPQSEILDEGGRKKDREENPNAGNGRDPRQHIQVIAGRAMAGTALPFKHNDGTTSKITAAMGRAITAHLQGLKPADRQAAVNKMHDSADGLRG